MFKRYNDRLSGPPVLPQPEFPIGQSHVRETITECDVVGDASDCADTFDPSKTNRTKHRWFDCLITAATAAAAIVAFTTSAPVVVALSLTATALWLMTSTYRHWNDEGLSTTSILTRTDGLPAAALCGASVALVSSGHVIPGITAILVAWTMTDPESLGGAITTVGSSVISSMSSNPLVLLIVLIILCVVLVRKLGSSSLRPTL